MALRLEEFGYEETDDARVRHQSLGRAVKSFGVDRVLNALRSRKRDRTGYRFRRLRADINWLKGKMG